jgi:type II secretory pathway predicted ATPase ExeA
MYKDYYLMQDEPFTSFPSPHLFYKSKGHTRAWKNLVYSIKKKEQVVMVAGEYGTGKTLLCLKMLQYMEKFKIQPRVHVPSSGFSFSMVLEKIAKTLDVPFNSSNTAESQRFIYEYFEASDPGNHKQIFIIIDDIQDFDYTFISELGKLITYNHYGNFPIRLYLFGHKNFFQNLDKRNLASFKQRIRVIPLLPLNFEDVTEYIYFRLIASGASGTPVFEDSAVELITQTSKGLPRLINTICDASLIIACKLKINVVDRQVVEAALAEGGFADFEASTSQTSHSDPVVQTTQKKSVHIPRESSRIVQPPEKETVVETPTKVLHRTEHLFSSPADSPDSPEKPDRHQKAPKKDLKKSSFLDGKTIAIIILIVILGLMVLFFIRELRLSSTQPLEMELKPSSMITKSIVYSETAQMPGSWVQSSPTGAMTVSKPIGNSHELPQSDRWTDHFIRPIVYEFFDKSDNLPMVLKNIDNDELQLNNSLFAFYENKNG